MMSTTDLADLTVERFWKDFNWFGQAPKLDPSDRVQPEPANWMEFSVAEFLARANWSGRSIIDPGSDFSREPLPLTLTVGEYFQALPWQGQARTPSTSPAPKSEYAAPVDRSLKVNDLSNLF